jgi:hypothetical protein
MTARPEALRVARRWIAKADEDLAAAERLLSLDERPATPSLMSRSLSTRLERRRHRTPED